jgi:lysophospholipase L1-like esterase
VREGLEVLDGSEGVLEGAEVPGIVFVAEMEGAGGDGDLLGGLEGALDLIHGGDAAGFFGIDQIEVWGDVAGPLGIGSIAEVERLVERGSYAAGVEPGRDIADGSAVGVVEVVAGGEELDHLSAGFVQSVEQAGVQALRKEDVGRESGLHHFLRYSSGRVGGVAKGVWRCSAKILVEGRVRMKLAARMILTGCVVWGGGMVHGQAGGTAPTEGAPTPAQTPAAGPTSAFVPPVSMTVERAKEIVEMRAKLADWPQLGRYRAENAALAPVAAGERRVVFYGDSITDSWGRLPATGEFFPGKPYVNRGISGQTTPQMVVRFRQDVIDLRPAAVVILAGTNDIAGNTGPMTLQMTEDNFRSMIDLAKTNGIQVIVASILPVADYPWKPGLAPAPKIKTLNDWLKGYCVNHSVTYLDYYSSMVGQDGGMKAGISFDGVHPNAQGYAIMGPLAQAVIDKTLGGK